jgi:alcohol dehydrogenase
MGLVKDADNKHLAHKALLTTLLDINRLLKVPTLEEFGVNQSDYDSLLQLMAEQALASGSVANNPKIPTVKEMIALYKEVW